MPENYLTFQKFNDPGMAAIIANQLQLQGIPCLLEKEDLAFDATFANNDFEPTTQLKLLNIDFQRAHSILQAYYGDQLQTMDPGYYLFSFTEAELMEIIQKPDEWGHLDYALAQQMLAQKGHLISKETEEEFRNKRMEDLAKPDTTHPLLIVLGYLSALAGGLLGILLGYIFAYLKKTLPNGKQVYMYPASERVHGKRILVIGLISFAIFIGLLITDGWNMMWMKSL